MTDKKTRDPELQEHLDRAVRQGQEKGLSRPDAEDVAITAVMEAVRNWKGAASFDTYLHGLMEKRVADFWRMGKPAVSLDENIGTDEEPRTRGDTLPAPTVPRGAEPEMAKAEAHPHPWHALGFPGLPVREGRFSVPISEEMLQMAAAWDAAGLTEIEIQRWSLSTLGWSKDRIAEYMKVTPHAVAKSLASARAKLPQP